MKLFHLFHSRLSDLIIIIIIIAWPPKTRHKKNSQRIQLSLTTRREKLCNLYTLLLFTSPDDRSFHSAWHKAKAQLCRKTQQVTTLSYFSRGEINQLSRRSRSNEIENRRRRRHACRPNSSKMRRVNKTQIFFFIYGVPSWNSNRLLKILFEEKKELWEKRCEYHVLLRHTANLISPEWCYSAMLIEILRWHLMDKKNICDKIRVPYRFVSVQWFFSCVWWRFFSVNRKHSRNDFLRKC